MGTPFLGEIKIVSFNFPPKGWAFCNGQFLPINQNQALFSILGTTYGGDGQTTFALPDFRGRIPLHVGSKTLGERGGEAVHTMTISEMPTHTHVPNASNTSGNLPFPAAGSPVVQHNIWAISTQNPYESPASPGFAAAAMNPGSVSNTGGSQPHENRQPYLVLNFIIALQGVFPSRN
ncbi:MAG: tail fiber protein [Pyrinomonadaceae bacterium]